MQGVDLSKIRGGRKGQQQVAQSIAFESANRVLTRRALDMLKSIAVGEYKPLEERQAEADKVLEEEAAAKAVEEASKEEVAQNEEKAPEAEAGAAESEADSSSESSSNSE